MAKYDFCIDVHDAFIVPVYAAEDVRKWYAEELTNVYNNRESILMNYFKSIGIRGAAAAKDWAEVMAAVTPVDNFVCSTEVLK